MATPTLYTVLPFATVVLALPRVVPPSVASATVTERAKDVWLLVAAITRPTVTVWAGKVRVSPVATAGDMFQLADEAATLPPARVTGVVVKGCGVRVRVWLS